GLQDAMRPDGPHGDTSNTRMLWALCILSMLAPARIGELLSILTSSTFSVMGGVPIEHSRQGRNDVASVSDEDAGSEDRLDRAEGTAAGGVGGRTGAAARSTDATPVTCHWAGNPSGRQELVVVRQRSLYDQRML